MMRFCLLVTAAVAACCAVGAGAGAKWLGSVAVVWHGTMDNQPARVGTTIYSGDSFSTDVGGGVAILLGRNLVTLRSASAAVVLLNGDRTQVSVRRGLVDFRGNEPGGVNRTASTGIEIDTPVGIIRAANSQPFFGDVTILSPTSALISDRQGVLTLESDGETHSMEEGKAYEVSLEPPDPNAPAAAAAAAGAQAAQGAGTGTSHKHKRVIFDVVLLGTAASTAACLWGTTESPSNFCGGSF